MSVGFELFWSILKSVIVGIILVGLFIGLIYLVFQSNYSTVEVEVISKKSDGTICYDEETERYWVITDSNNFRIGEKLTLTVDVVDSENTKDDIIRKVNGVEYNGGRYFKN